MSFITSKMTEKKFVANLEKLFQRDGFFTKKEVGVGYGVADLVLFQPHIRNCVKRIEHNQSKCLMHEGYFRVFNSLPDINSKSLSMSLSELCNATAYSTGFLKYKLISDLKRTNYVVETEKGYYMKINGWLPIGKEVIAIEAKLHDWKRGFYQAHRYRVFADRVYLAVPANVVSLVDKELLKKHGVGLIGFDVKNNSKRIEIETAKRKPLNESKRNLASEFFWNGALRHSLTTI